MSWWQAGVSHLETGVTDLDAGAKATPTHWHKTVTGTEHKDKDALWHLSQSVWQGMHLWDLTLCDVTKGTLFFRESDAGLERECRS